MKILVAYDDSNTAKAALKLAQTHAENRDAEIHVLKHQDQSLELGYEEICKAEEKLKSEVHDMVGTDKSSCHTHLLVSSLTAGEELVEFAKRRNFDEIIVGVRRRSKVGKLIFGSTVQFVILNAPCPVVTIK